MNLFRVGAAGWCLAFASLCFAQTGSGSGLAPTNNQEQPADQTPAMPPPATGSVDFAREIKPIFAKSCISCHGSRQQDGKFRLDKKETFFAGGEHGPALKPGDSANSTVIRYVAGVHSDGRMPPEGEGIALDPPQVSLLRAWIDQGANWPDGVSITKSKSTHWAFQPIVRPAPPDVTSAAAGQVENLPHVRNPIDQFVLARLQKEGFQASPEADRVTLIRRLTLDLTGLPPTPQEVDEFASDTRPDAYERLVERLLDSRQYGERMAQDWLDLARYGDTNGYHFDSDRQMWLWRDWVIAAFNSNMPFDQFTTEQLAGDLLPSATVAQRIATGFIRNATYNEEGGADPDEFLVSYAADRANTLGTVYLGLTLMCARCHDHKYDPISMKDYYQLYSFFNSIDGEKGAQGHDQPLPPLLAVPSPQQAARQTELAKLIDESKARICEAVASAKIDEQPFGLAAIPLVGPNATTAGVATVPVPAKSAFPALATFTHESLWESIERRNEKSKLPQPIRDILKIEPVQRTDPQRHQLHEHYIEFVCTQTRPTFEPLHKQLDALSKEQKELESAIPTTMVVVEMKERRPAYVLARGDFQQKAELVSPDVPAIFPPMPSDKPKDRIALAHWVMSGDNPLTARVTVNRLWKQFFGIGLVRTVDDFGAQGEPPSHPELLDWLASEFMNPTVGQVSNLPTTERQVGNLPHTPWDIKRFIRLLVTSATYRQASQFQPNQHEADPYYRLLWRQGRFRLPAEQIRDVALAASGLLNRDIGGKSVYPYQPAGYYGDKGRWSWPQSKGNDLYRRGLYTFWRRTTFYPSFQIFDAPSREQCAAARTLTNTPLQALVTLNDPTFVEGARVLAQRVMTEGGPTSNDRITVAFRLVLARTPTDAERQTLLGIYESHKAKLASDMDAATKLASAGESPRPANLDAVEHAAWTSVANVILNLDEAITRE